MEYAIEYRNHLGVRIDTTTNPAEVYPRHFINGHHIAIGRMEEAVMTPLHSMDELASWLIGAERYNQWERQASASFATINEASPVQNIERAVNPAHYQDYANGLQWLETMSKIPTLRKPSRFKAAVELQVRKYLDRNGSKDAELQELKKALWYLKALVSYIENGNILDISKMDVVATAKDTCTTAGSVAAEGVVKTDQSYAMVYQCQGNAIPMRFNGGKDMNRFIRFVAGGDYTVWHPGINDDSFNREVLSKLKALF
jgi:hypothetical protein